MNAGRSGRLRVSGPRILILLGSTITHRRRSGVHRVTVETARALSGLAEVDLVRWDALEEDLRFLDLVELDGLFGAGTWPSGVRLQRTARKLGRPFREQLDRPEETWLLTPEVSHQEPHGTEHLARVITECRIWGVRTAAVFYDLIPLHNPAYRKDAALHEAYVAELSRCDLVIPISAHSSEELAQLWRTRGVEPSPPIAPILLPDGGFASEPTPGQAVPLRQPLITLVGTVEPRKHQVRFLEAMRVARARSPAVAAFKALVIGSLHPDIAEAFNGLLARNGWIEYRDYASDTELRAALKSSAFSAFISEDEGYGLPIGESLALGTPCLCADFGAMAEVAAGGGCRLVDVRDPAALEQAVVELCESPNRLNALRAEIKVRRFRSWSDYGHSILAALEAGGIEGPR